MMQASETNMLMKLGFSSKRDHDFRTQEERLRDLIGSLERIEIAVSSQIWLPLLTSSVFFFSIVVGAIDRKKRMLGSEGRVNEV